VDICTGQCRRLGILDKDLSISNTVIWNSRDTGTYDTVGQHTKVATNIVEVSERLMGYVSTGGGISSRLEIGNRRNCFKGMDEHYYGVLDLL
jgi:hypothetical protein